MSGRENEACHPWIINSQEIQTDGKKIWRLWNKKFLCIGQNYSTNLHILQINIPDWYQLSPESKVRKISITSHSQIIYQIVQKKWFILHSRQIFIFSSDSKKNLKNFKCFGLCWDFIWSIKNQNHNQGQTPSEFQNLLLFVNVFLAFRIILVPFGISGDFLDFLMILLDMLLTLRWDLGFSQEFNKDFILRIHFWMNFYGN